MIPSAALAGSQVIGGEDSSVSASRRDSVWRIPMPTWSLDQHSLHLLLPFSLHFCCGVLAGQAGLALEGEQEIKEREPGSLVRVTGEVNSLIPGSCQGPLAVLAVTSWWPGARGCKLKPWSPAQFLPLPEYLADRPWCPSDPSVQRAQFHAYLWRSKPNYSHGAYSYVTVDRIVAKQMLPTSIGWTSPEGANKIPPWFSRSPLLPALLGWFSGMFC